MDRPSCSTPSDKSVIEVSYWEAVRAYWRVYWPAQLVGIARLCIGKLLAVSGTSIVVLFATLFLLLSAALFLLVPRLVSGPYRGFSLVMVATSSGETGCRLRPDQQGRVWFFLLWRHLAATLLAGFLAILLSGLLFAFLLLSDLTVLQARSAVAGFILIGPVLATVFIIGPVLVKMLVGHPFPDFSIEARREYASRPRSGPLPVDGRCQI